MLVRRESSPSALKITDIKICKVDLPPWGCHLVRFDTNQDISGFGEMRDGASAAYLKMLKSRLLGENPCDVDRLFRKIKQFGGPGRQSAGVCAAEIALWDLAGKAYGVPVYQLVGGKFRDRVRRYADIHIEDGRFTGRLLSPHKVGETLKGYMNEGFAALKILSVELITTKEGNCCGPTDRLAALRALEAEGRQAGLSGDRAEAARVNMRLMDINRVPHPFTHLHITEKGLEELEAYIAAVRGVIGYQVPLAIDHFGHFPLPDMIKIARRLERFNLAWLEDMLPWYMTNDYAALRRAAPVPLATGEDIYLAENFEPLLAAGGVDLVHPDILTVGGILETKRLGDLAQKHNASMAIHMCESPVASIAACHAAVAAENFFALEYDAFDSPWWADIILGPARQFVTPEQGMTAVSDAPGLGIDAINEDVIRAHGPLHGGAGDVWQSTDEWNGESSLDRVWS